jgi:hypothetical protein
MERQGLHLRNLQKALAAWLFHTFMSNPPVVVYARCVSIASLTLLTNKSQYWRGYPHNWADLTWQREYTLEICRCEWCVRIQFFDFLFQVFLVCGHYLVSMNNAIGGWVNSRLHQMLIDLVNREPSTTQPVDLARVLAVYEFVYGVISQPILMQQWLSLNC